MKACQLKLKDVVGSYLVLLFWRSFCVCFYRSFQGNLAYYCLLSKVCPPCGTPDMQTSHQV